MNTFLKYLGAFCLLTIAASLAFCSMGIYNGMKTANRLLAGADTYTCRQFTYDMTDPASDKFPGLLIAAIAYGGGPKDAEGKGTDPKETEARQDDVIAHGIEPAVRKVTKLCVGNPDARVLNLFAQSLVSGTAPVVSPTQPAPATSITK